MLDSPVYRPGKTSISVEYQWQSEQNLNLIECCILLVTQDNLGIWSGSFQVLDNLKGSTLVDLCEIWLEDCMCEVVKSNELNDKKPLEGC